MDRLDLVAALRPNVSVSSWARGRDALVWHARLAALGAAALVLANVALSPDRLWAAGPLAVWAVLLLAHAGVVAWAWRAGNPGWGRPVARRWEPAAAAVAAPVFAATSPTVERPRFRPSGPDAETAAAASPVVAPRRSGSGLASDAARPDRAAANEDVVVVPTAPTTPERAVREDVLVGAVAAPHPSVPADAAPIPAATQPTGAPRGERQDVAVSVVVLPQGAAQSQDEVVRAAHPPAASPILPDHVVALWRATPPRPAAPAAGWGVGPPYPVDAPIARGWPVPGERTETEFA